MPLLPLSPPVPLHYEMSESVVLKRSMLVQVEVGGRDSPYLFSYNFKLHDINSESRLNKDCAWRFHELGCNNPANYTHR